MEGPKPKPLMPSILKDLEENFLIVPYDLWLAGAKKTIARIKERLPDVEVSLEDCERSKLWYMRYIRQCNISHLEFLKSILGCAAEKSAELAKLHREVFNQQNPGSGNNYVDAVLKSTFEDEQLFGPSYRASIKKVIEWETESEAPTAWKKPKPSRPSGPQSSWDLDSVFSHPLQPIRKLSPCASKVEDENLLELPPPASPSSDTENELIQAGLDDFSELPWRLRRICVPKRDEIEWTSYVLDKLYKPAPRPKFVTAADYELQALKHRFYDPRYTVLKGCESPVRAGHVMHAEKSNDLITNVDTLVNNQQLQDIRSGAGGAVDGHDLNTHRMITHLNQFSHSVVERAENGLNPQLSPFMMESENQIESQMRADVSGIVLLDSDKTVAGKTLNACKLAASRGSLGGGHWKTAQEILESKSSESVRTDGVKIRSGTVKRITGNMQSLKKTSRWDLRFSNSASLIGQDLLRHPTTAPKLQLYDASNPFPGVYTPVR